MNENNKCYNVGTYDLYYISNAIYSIYINGPKSLISFIYKLHKITLFFCVSFQFIGR